MKRITGTLMVLVMTGAAAAQSGPDAPSFAQLDANQDGRISAEEARADERVVERFLDADSDRDGYLSVEEFTAVWQ